MARNTVPFKLISILVLFFSCKCYCMEHNKKAIRGMFVFGSSLVDNGNNNFINTVVKSDFLPYGVDFRHGPTGRFTNGKNVIDLIGDKLHLPLIPPFYDPATIGRRIIHGVSFSSGASGILNETGTDLRVIGLHKQMKNFEEVTLPQLETLLGETSEKFLKDYLFVFGVGGNDYTLNFFYYPQNVTIEVFTTNLINSLSDQLQTLYNLGARKFVMMSVYPLGCYPSARKSHELGAVICLRHLNEAAEIFNSKLKSLVDSIHSIMPASTIVYVDCYDITMDLIVNPASYGFEDSTNTCCEVTSESNFSACRKNGQICEDRSKFVFFDGVHPTEAVNDIIINKAFNSDLQSEVYPINIKQLLMNQLINSI
ncbi:GDSL esterase/lipase At4g16230-like [Mercurialis annua]|uniref:GDSL esterase/lipase At4g16230-like n=1 Tax=Mercurialis annua TaxID=3986 RepID=UPI00215F3931|nr:GDSL esterase/lipase At4g16230-like [Mercurialis annua]